MDASVQELQDKLKNGLYKYVVNGRVIYVGMSNAKLGKGIAKRIEDHSREEKFKPYLKNARIYVAPIPDKNLIKSYETMLIDQHMPILNVSEKPAHSSGVDFESIFPYKWEPFEDYEKEIKRLQAKCSKPEGTSRKMLKMLALKKEYERNIKMLPLYAYLEKAINNGQIIDANEEGFWVELSEEMTRLYMETGVRSTVDDGEGNWQSTNLVGYMKFPKNGRKRVFIYNDNWYGPLRLEFLDNLVAMEHYYKQMKDLEIPS